MSIYLEWLVFVAASFVVDIAGIFVVPIALAVSRNASRLPAWAQWWDNDREPMGDTERYAEIKDAGFCKALFLRWHWLAIRNPGNNFGYVLGFVQSEDVGFYYNGDPKTSDQGHPGTLRVWAYRGDELSSFCYYKVLRWGSSSRCLRIFIGWKIHDMVLDGTKAQLVCVVNPLMTFKESGR